jgi:hypothetical protein
MRLVVRAVRDLIGRGLAKTVQVPAAFLPVPEKVAGPNGRYRLGLKIAVLLPIPVPSINIAAMVSLVIPEQGG